MKDDQPSSTARLIAASLVMLSREKSLATTIPDEAVRLGEWLLRSFSGASRLMLRGLDYQIFRSAVQSIEGLTIPGILHHYVARKATLERLARMEITRGIRQIQILGAGFDSLGCRLVREFPELQVREIDHPATQAWKVRGLRECGLGNDRLTFAARDLSNQGSLHDEVVNEPQLWIAEGLLMYFPQDRIDSLFEELHRQSSTGNRFAFTHLESTNGRPEFRRGSRLVARWLDRHQESFAWGIQRTQLPEFLASKKMRSLPIEPLIIQEMTDLNVGEYLVLAESI